MASSSSHRPLLHVCCGAYELGLIGGVPRYDHQLKRVFPHRMLATNQEGVTMALRRHPECLVIADNHYALLVPTHVPCIVVHHGCAREHCDRAAGTRPDLVAIADAQARVWQYRDPSNTRVISIAAFCTMLFETHYGDAYRRFPRACVPHASEHDERVEWRATTCDAAPIRVLGNFAGSSKGDERIRGLLDEIGVVFVRLSVRPASASAADIAAFERRKQQAYLDCDVFMQLSIHEGNSYAALDALAIGMPIVATDVGAFHSDVPRDCFVRIPWTADRDAIVRAIREAHARRAVLSSAARAFYTANWSFGQWAERMRAIVAAA